MNTIFDNQSVIALTNRINSLNKADQAQWGKMNAYQMLKHCTLADEMFQGKKEYKRLFIGRLFGRMALNGILKNENPMKKSQPTHPELKITGTGDFENEQQNWINTLSKYNEFSNQSFTHPFFGKMSKDEIGQFVYKHTDHHLKQFGR